VAGRSFTLGVFTTTSVKLKGNTLIFAGTRKTLVRDAEKKVLVRTGDTAMRLEIDLVKVPKTVSLPMLEKMLFFEDESWRLRGCRCLYRRSCR
jgi:hypothetical protein